jgi:Outer membrane protein beta-barrel domain
MEKVPPRTIPAAVLLLTMLLACAVSAAAQEIPTEVRPGAGLTVGGTVSEYKLSYGENSLGGASVYTDFNLTTHYGIEGEARWLLYHQQANVHTTTWLVGPRVLFDFRALHGMTPYVKLLVGDGDFNFPYNYATGQYFVMAPGAGVDLPIAHRLNIRLIDVEYQTWPQFSFGALHTYGVSAGISYHIF